MCENELSGDAYFFINICSYICNYPYILSIFVFFFCLYFARSEISYDIAFLTNSCLHFELVDRTYPLSNL